MASAKDFIVGDDKGWTTNFNYQAWAKGKNFRVGDRLVFKYPVGSHNVFKVSGPGFQNCIKPPLSEALKTGNDVIVLATPGQKWYICGVANHCDKAGMRLSIFVNAKPSPPIHVPSPSSPLRKPKDFIVGDERGWTKFVDYQAWANGKDFRVGDKLVFNYRVGVHNVFKVTEGSFFNCIKSPLEKPRTSGKDIIVLKTPGQKFYLCGVADHCAKAGMKLFINVN
ncbi:hypothetical protein Acr_00g0027870 [Actinidia rufa]|uniref:Phytocyanin domain-containing protein n=1 Tax=Actinidia rufa TaxID=165716 RepID=A0A7J0DEQ3_9ERIC|nr:hypothetical protein Acr_00g0027870 [Actinidia rufa]